MVWDHAVLSPDSLRFPFLLLLDSALTHRYLHIIATSLVSAMSEGAGKTSQVQNQVNEVVGIMQGAQYKEGRKSEGDSLRNIYKRLLSGTDNINKVMQRGEQLDTLQNKTDDLQNSSLQFKRGASRVRKAMWWKDMKVSAMGTEC